MKKIACLVLLCSVGCNESVGKTGFAMRASELDVISESQVVKDLWGKKLLLDNDVWYFVAGEDISIKVERQHYWVNHDTIRVVALLEARKKNVEGVLIGDVEITYSKESEGWTFKSVSNQSGRLRKEIK